MNIRLETLFKERFGEYYVLPDGFTFSAGASRLTSWNLTGFARYLCWSIFWRGAKPFFFDCFGVCS